MNCVKRAFIVDQIVLNIDIYEVEPNSATQYGRITIAYNIYRVYIYIYIYIYTVEPLYNGHPRDWAKVTLIAG